MYRKRERTEKRTIENETAPKTGLRRGERRQKCLALSAGLPFDRPKARRAISAPSERVDLSGSFRRKIAEVRNLHENPVFTLF